MAEAIPCTGNSEFSDAVSAALSEAWAAIHFVGDVGTEGGRVGLRREERQLRRTEV
jgi:6-phosphogluconate dehydrogenase (decarboxylating)